MVDKSPDRVRVLGIDCGTAITGWAILDCPVRTSGANKKLDPKLVSCGIIETHKFTPEEFRLQDLGSCISELIEEFKPQELAIEDIFFFKNAKTVIKVSQARGVVIYEAVKHGLIHNSYTPLQVKQQLTGYGRAEKKQIMFLINTIFKDVKIDQDDAADAVAIAYCHSLNLMTGLNGK